ncbi:nicotinate-nucleotide--dimethylbenzimidazole phosphoribosyltransferase [Caldalkalibacillus salinus]|uniref:nicotinate-nucleotide--dimethylbenzimidazole phosphoribosyltransferase n=1 Tax=Caldalkalibacillus salinus TaxID=2803787 RepID=UPI001923E98A|nr:nicotinate-nucleotide--dimethylbenzimidazole phosphoribosyltransferase [Caldalkalibacillus salinus]
MSRFYDITVPELNKDTGRHTSDYLDTLTKPPGSLGRLESLVIELAEMRADAFPTVTPPGVIVFAADHGVTAEGVSAFPQEVTKQMVSNFLQGGAAINVFSQQIGAVLEVVDIGVSGHIDASGLVRQKVRHGTRNMFIEDALTREEVEQALEIGYQQAKEMIQDKGIGCLIVGEMGIGNTTTSSAVLAALSGEDVSRLVGRGTGIPEAKLRHKQNVIERSLERGRPDKRDPIDILSKVGGLEIAGMAGAMLAAAKYRVPILLDGYICGTAALIAKLLVKRSTDYMLNSHRSAEPGHDLVLHLLGKEPLIDLDLRLGEGSGAAVAFPLLLSATSMLKEMATFSAANVSTN